MTSQAATIRADSKQGSRFWFTIPYRPDHDAANVHTRSGRLSGKLQLGLSRKSVVMTVAPKFISIDMNSSTKPLRILLVDDALTILKMTSRTLLMSGHSVETAENGLESLECMKEAYELGDIDVVLTDLQMPVMDGIESTRRYREFEAEREAEVIGGKINSAEHASGRRLIIIGMSANSDAQTAADAIKSGMDGFIGKPFNYKDFERTLMNVKHA